MSRIDQAREAGSEFIRGVKDAADWTEENIVIPMTDYIAKVRRVLEALR